MRLPGDGRALALAAAAVRRRIGAARAFHNEERFNTRTWKARLQERQARDDFPEVELKTAFRMCRRGALPIDSVPLSSLPQSRTFNEQTFKQAHEAATGDVRLLLDAIDRGCFLHPPLSWAPSEEGAASKLPPKISEAAVVMELNRVWDIREELGRGRPMTAQIVNGVLRASLNAAAAMHFFNWAGSEKHKPFFEHSTLTYNGLIEMLVKRSFFNEAIRAYRLMLENRFITIGCGADRTTLGLLVRALLSDRQNHLSVAVNLLNDAISREEQCSTNSNSKKSKKSNHKLQLVGEDLLHDMIEYLCKKQDMIPLALRFFQRCEHPGAATYQCLVSAMMLAGNVDESYALMVSMAVTRGLPTDDVTYHTMIAEFCRRGELSKAHVLLHDLMERGRVPTVLAFNLVLGLLRDKAGTSQDCGEKALVLRDSMIGKGVPLNVITYSTLVDLLSKVGKVDEALALFKEMLSKDMNNIDSQTGKSLLTALIKAQRLEEARDFLLKIKWLHLSCSLGLEDYAAVVYGFLRLGKVQHAMEAFRQLQGNLFQPDLTMYNVFISILCKKGRFVLARELFREASEKKLFTLNSASFCPFVVSYSERGQVPDAYKMFRAMLARKLTPNLITYKAMVTAFCGIGSMNDAARILEHMFNRDCYPDEELYKSVINGLQRSGNTQACDMLADALNRSTRDGGNVVAREHMFKAVFRLRSCIRSESRKQKESLGSDEEDDQLEDAQIEEPLGDLEADLADGGEEDASTEVQDEDDDSGTCREILHSLTAAGVDERRPGWRPPIFTENKKKVWKPRY